MATNDWSGVHPQAIVDPSAKLADNVTGGPWSYIGPGVEIGEGTEILSHVVIKGPTVIGRNNRIFQFSSIGEECQDKKYAGELTTLVIGDDNVIDYDACRVVGNNCVSPPTCQGDGYCPEIAMSSYIIISY